MDWLEMQIETRARLDTEATERAYLELASSIIDETREPTFGVNDLERSDSAVRLCLKYFGITTGDVPSRIKDPMERLEWLCRPTGTMHRRVRLEKNWYKKTFGPLLGQLDTGENVALLPKGVGDYYYIDPSSGKRVFLNQENAKHISADAIMFYRPLPPRKLTTIDLLRFALRVLRRSDYLAVVLAALVTTVIGLLPALANKIAFSTVVPGGQVDLVLPLAGMLLGVAVSTALINICRNIITTRVSIKLSVSCEAAIFARVLSLPASFFKQYSSGNLASRVATVSQLVKTLSGLILGAGLSLVMSFAYIVQIAAFTPALAWPAIIIVASELTFIVLATRITKRYERAMMEASATVSGTVTALLNGIQKIKLAGAEDRAFAKWGLEFAEYARNRYTRPMAVEALVALVTLMGLIGNIVVYYCAGVAEVSLGDYMAFNVAYGEVCAAISLLANVAYDIASVDPMIKMVEPILAETPEVAANKPSVARLNGGIEVSGVSFRYSENSPYVVNNLSFEIKRGEYVAIVGKSGCGKSTIMRLLLGFEKPERGSIFFGQYDLQQVDLRSLRQHVGMVMQDGRLFMGDIFQNITISTPNATIDDAWAAAELAGIADDIRKMPMGMQTLVTEGGGSISGGQRQRIMIARAICGKKNILMFDEATSALDNVTQKHVTDALAKLRCTRIVIAHRLSTVRHCDRILVVDSGNIVEEGTYDELMEQQGYFADLVARQQTD